MLQQLDKETNFLSFPQMLAAHSRSFTAHVAFNLRTSDQNTEILLLLRTDTESWAPAAESGSRGAPETETEKEFVLQPFSQTNMMNIELIERRKTGRLHERARMVIMVTENGVTRRRKK